MYCLLEGDGSNANAVGCSEASAQIKAIRPNCTAVGPDLLVPLELSSYTAIECTLCDQMVSETRRVTTAGLLTCEQTCDEDQMCRGFDFDSFRNYCRLWGSCPASARLTNFGCQWTSYTRPADKIPTTLAPSTTVMDTASGDDEAENATMQQHAVTALDSSRFCASCTVAWCLVARLVLLRAL